MLDELTWHCKPFLPRHLEAYVCVFRCINNKSDGIFSTWECFSISKSTSKEIHRCICSWRTVLFFFPITAVTFNFQFLCGLDFWVVLCSWWTVTLRSPEGHAWWQVNLTFANDKIPREKIPPDKIVKVLIR